jgi:hypothetical protein
MDWEDFEHLCRELFERAFAGSEAQVKPLSKVDTMPSDLSEKGPFGKRPSS